MLFYGEMIAAIAEVYLSHVRTKRPPTPKKSAYVDPFQEWATELYNREQELLNLTGLS